MRTFSSEGFRRLSSYSVAGCGHIAQHPPGGRADARGGLLDRLQWHVAELRGHLDRLAAVNAIMARELGTS
jgi:hypothetical protein